jgi:DNA-binding response OmpR family regulator
VRLPTVALVEDHLLLAETLSAALRLCGIDATVYPPREHAALLDTLLTARPDLLLLDLDLGRFGDSTPLVAPLKAAGVPVLVVTGTTDRLGIAAALEQGAIGYQSKVAGFDALVASASVALNVAGALSVAGPLTLSGTPTELRGSAILDPAGRAELLEEPGKGSGLGVTWCP